MATLTQLLMLCQDHTPPFINLLSPFGINGKGYPYVSLHVILLSSTPSATYCLLPLSPCCAFSPYHDALSTLSPPLSLRAKGIPPNVFHILFMIFMWTSIMFSIYFLKYLHQLSHYDNWLSSPSSASFFIIPRLNSSFLNWLFSTFAYDLFWCAPLSSMHQLS